MLENNLDSESSLNLATKLEEATLRSEHPNNRLYIFEGSFKMRGFPRAISIDN